MKPILAVLLYTLLTKTLCAQDIDKVTIDLDLKNVSLAQALEKIESLTTFKFTYRTEYIKGVKGITYQQRQVTVKKALTNILANTSLSFEQVQQYIVIRRNVKSATQTITLYGFVKSVQSGETLAGATLSITSDKNYYTTTNAYGFYSLTVPAGTYQLSCSYIGFQDLDKKVDLRATTIDNIELQARTESQLQSVVVATTGNKRIIRRTITGSQRLDIAEIKKIIMPGGEPDVLKSMQLLPGIQTANEGTTNLSVRGGSYDQNLILLDEAPVYNPSHTLGFFSTFNSDAIKDVSIYKSVFPVQYGGRLSSVVDIRMKEGNSKQQTLSGGVGLLASRLTFEGPLKKDKSSFMISGRYSNIGKELEWAQKLPTANFKTSNSKVSFYDLNAKFNPILGDKDRLFLSAYTGHDDFYLDLIDQSNRMTWGNTTVSLRWNHVFTPAFFANTSILYSDYRYGNSNKDQNKKYKQEGGLREATIKTDMEWQINTGNLLKFGAGITGQIVTPGKITPLDTGTVSKLTSLRDRNSAQFFAYFGNDQRVSKSLTISYGIRATGFAALGEATVYKYNADTTKILDSTHYGKGQTIKAYFSTEPRATARLLLNNETSLKFSIGRNYQFQHLLTNSSVGLPSDIWVPSDSYFKPQYSDEYAAGYYQTFRNATYEASLEAYYRRSHNIIDFRDNAEIFLNDRIETQVLTGKARGYGLELFLKKTKGLTTGWLSYTYSKTQRQIEGVNDNHWYPPPYDHRHNFSLILNRTINTRWSLSATWVYRSGGYTSVPAGSYFFGGTRFLYYTERNGYSLPSYHRLDISATLQGKRNPTRKWQGEWVFSIYNLYNRENIFAIYVRQDVYNLTSVKASKVYLVGILPTITYNFKF